jgi:hypothetical protein
MTKKREKQMIRVYTKPSPVMKCVGDCPSCRRIEGSEFPPLKLQYAEFIYETKEISREEIEASIMEGKFPNFCPLQEVDRAKTEWKIIPVGRYK